MDSSGRIYTGDEIAKMPKEARDKLELQPIPHRELQRVLAMSVEDRMAWHAKRKAARHAEKHARGKRRSGRRSA